ncbi:GUN4 domain-containing protein [Trichocoleus sp. DQ-A3]|uniref:GUN4 domain-containing protein n=1 Tax=Cyanophyceae TaxID=3028117 RepID=UPI00168931CB|nr:GUN4 domain-containing protein [Coleofasciculus sp. FACHB-125]MBD1899941.1 GUN4 domain-containing protein [Coleofasciculus sp. FACHB-125]
MGRKPIPPSIEIEVLTQSARRCCICFGLYQKFDVIKGQIAHLDHDNTNNKLDNLAFLCLDCHDEYDSKTSQGKGLTLQEVKRYRKLLYQEITKLRSLRTTQAPASIIDGLNQTIETEEAPLQSEIMNQEPLMQSSSSEYPDVLSSELGKNYRILRDLLAENDWQAADVETMALMREVFGGENVNNFPLVDLQTIDSLWLKYSNSRFGFSVQRRVLEYTFRDSKVTPETCLSDYERLKCIEDYSDRLSKRWPIFGENLGWYNQGQWIMAIDYSHNAVNKPEGYLPLLGVAPRFLTVHINRRMMPWWWVLLLRLKPWKS